MPKGQVPIHIMRLAPADYVNDPFVRRLYQKRDHRTAAFYPAFLFWCHMEGGDLPSDVEELAAILLMRVVDVRPSLAVCMKAGKIVEENGRLYNPRVRREVDKELEFRRVQAELGKKGAQARIDKVAQGQPKATLSGPQNVPKGSLSPPSPSPAPLPAPAPAPDAPAVPPPPTTRGPGPMRPPPRWPAWLAAYGAVYQAAYGPESEPPWGEMNQFIGPLVERHDHAVILARWTRFCRAKGDAQWCRPKRFVESFGQWSSDRAAPPTDGRRPTASEVTRSAVREIFAEEDARARSKDMHEGSADDRGSRGTPDDEGTVRRVLPGPRGRE